MTNTVHKYCTSRRLQTITTWFSLRSLGHNVSLGKLKRHTSLHTNPIINRLSQNRRWIQGTLRTGHSPTLCFTQELKQVFFLINHKFFPICHRKEPLSSVLFHIIGHRQNSVLSIAYSLLQKNKTNPNITLWLTTNYKLPLMLHIIWMRPL